MKANSRLPITDLAPLRVGLILGCRHVQNPCSPLRGVAQAIIVHTDGSHLWLVFDLRR